MTAPAATSSALSKDVLLVLFITPPNEEWISRVKAKHPGLEIRWANILEEGGSFKNMKDPGDDIFEGATLGFCFQYPPSAERLKSMRFIQLPSAGIDFWSGHETFARKEVTFCTANGVHAPQIAEWVIGSYLSHQHHFKRYTESMKTGLWESPFATTVQDCTAARMGVLGYGAIGRQAARIAKSMRMEIYAYTRSERPTPESRKDDSYCVPETGDPDGLLPAKWFHGASKEAINDFLGQDLDILVLALPLTKESQGLISTEQFEILSKKKTFVSNVARGGIINTDALMEALESGKIRGAALDVTDPEPLPADHKLWSTPNLLITPHVSWQSQDLMSRVLDMLEFNLDNLGSGRPLTNVVSKEFGY